MNFTNINKVNIYCWALYCIYAIFTLTIFGYGVYFLQNFSFSYLEIGMTIGISALISSAIQPLIGRIGDSKGYSWKSILIILTVIMLASSLGIFIAPNSLLILFGLMIVALGCMYPFLNTGVFYYKSHGINTNFGISRGFASLSYMIFAAIMGLILTNDNFMIINVFTVISAIIMLLLLYLLPYYGNDSISPLKNKSKNLKDNVLFKYPVFTLVFISMVLFMIFHNVFVCYMVNIFENVGGNISDVSACNSIGALLELPTMFLFYKLLEKVSAKKLIIIASILYVVRSLVIFTAQNPLGIYLSLILHMFTFAIIIPGSVHFTNEIISEENKYEGQAFMGSTLTIGLIFANFLGGNILQLYDVDLLLFILVIITVMGCIFALSTLIVDKN